jgi:hypothetical protein
MSGAGPNFLAYAALSIWPLICLLLFRALGPSRGLIVGLLGGYLLLPPVPAGFELPVLPALNKDTIPAFAVLSICLLLFRTGLRLWPAHFLARLLLATYFIGQVLTISTNGDPIYWGTFVMPGLRLQDTASALLGQLATVIPFLLGRAFLAGEEDHRRLLWAMVISTFAYSFPMLLEVRLSPQLNIWIYGYFQHSFEQMMRGGGFRPIVFLVHGLWVAFLTAAAIIAACTLARADERKGPAAWYLGIWLLVVLILCKSLASLIYVLALAPVVLLASVRMQVRLAAFAALLAMAYPTLRGADLFPTETLVKTAARISIDRAESLDYRFDNEEVLLDRARERPLFGWGGWGRNLVREANTGKALTVTDGRWIIAIGFFGWTGFLSEFGLVALPLLLIWWRGGTPPPRVVAGGMLIVGVNMVDMIPNATLTPLTWLFSGALLGWAEGPQVATTVAPAAPQGPTLPVLLGAGAESGIRAVL